MRKISVKFVCVFFTNGTGADVVLRYSLYIALAAILFGGAEPFGLFWQTTH